MDCCCGCNPCCVNSCRACSCCTTNTPCVCCPTCYNRQGLEITIDLSKCRCKPAQIKDDTPKNINMRFSTSFKTCQNRYKPQPITLRKDIKTKGTKKASSKGKGTHKKKVSAKKKSRGRSKGKSKSKSSSSKSSKSKSTSKNRKGKKGGKGKGKSRSKKKNRGRSKHKSGRKPRGPPPTPDTTDIRKAQTQAFERLEKFNKFRLDQGPFEIPLVHELRGYFSEPEMTIPCEQKFEFRKKYTKFNPKYPSMEDLTLRLQPAENLLRICSSSDDDDMRKYSVAPSTWKKWFDLLEMERQRFSFFDELYAKKYVTDSMELPRFNQDILYLIEADDMHYRTKIDYGRIVLKTKHIYTGNFIDWYFQGPGRYVWLDGGVYQGDFLNGVMHGQGIFLWADGAIYEGQFHEGVRKGWGVYTTPTGYIFTGEWVEGVPNGIGKIWFHPAVDPENYYEGNLVRGQPDGFGIRQYANGDLYIGTWSEGVRSGRGTMLWRDQKQMYKGKWADGVPHGDGIQVWYVPHVHEKEDIKKYTRFIFKGSFESGLRHGKGQIFYHDSSVYEGYWSKGRQLEDGVYTDPCGEFLLSLQCVQPDEAGFVEEVFDKNVYECIFKKLVASLAERIPIKSKDPELTEERLLTNICFKYSPELRMFYQRAIDLGAIWTNNTLGNKNTGPNNSGKNCFNGKNASKVNYGGLHSIFSRLNELSAHDILPASRFGLWLFVRDCENTMKQATMAHYNKHWSSIPSICFQDQYSPFEVVHFWQFLQCLVVVAFEMYAGIPFDKNKAKYMPRATDQSGEVGEPEVKIVSTKSGLSDRSLLSQTAVEASSALLDTGEEEMGEGDDECGKYQQIPEPEGVDFTISISELFEMFIQENLFKCFDRLAGTLLPPLPSPLPPMHDLYEGFLSIKNQGVITAVDFLRSMLPHKVYPDNMKSGIHWTRTKQILSVDVTLNDLFERTRELQIEEDVYIPKPVEVDSGGAGDQLKGPVEPIEIKGKISTSEEHRRKHSKVITSKTSIVDDEQTTESQALPNLCRPLPPDPSFSIFDENPPRKPRFLEENIHSIEAELLIPDESVAVDAEAYKRNYSITTTNELRNLESVDVIGVLRELYPDLCGYPPITCLTFDMVFCDWLWAVILCSRASSEKDYGDEPCRKTSCDHFRMPLAISKIQEEGLHREYCCNSNRLVNNRNFYFDEILPTFYKHEEVRRGEMWTPGNYRSTNTNIRAPQGENEASERESTVIEHPVRDD